MEWTRRVKRLLRPLLRTPLHPQWLIRDSGRLRAALRAIPPEGLVLDIGSASQWPREHLADPERYISLDFPTTGADYGSRPAIHGDAHRLPVADASIDVVLLLDVLEHLRAPERALQEASRVLRRGGKAILQVPFLYPLHDAPHDHTRWTEFGHRALAARHGFEVEQVSAAGAPLATAGLLASIALADAAIRAIEARSPAVLLVPLAVVMIPLINCAAWLLARVFPDSPLMPYSYLSVWTKATD